MPDLNSPNPAVPTFGRRSNAGGGSASSSWIRTFKDAKTIIRFCWGDPAAWYPTEEHYDHLLKISYPCAKSVATSKEERDSIECVGCSYPVEHEEYANFKDLGMTREERRKEDPGWGIRDRSSKYIFPALLIEKAEVKYVNLYKIGYTFFQDLEANYNGLLKDAGFDYTSSDYAIIRSGDSWNSTSYQAQPVPGSPATRESKVRIPGDEEIAKQQAESYAHALKTYGYDDGSASAPPARAPQAAQEPVTDPAPVSDEAQAAPPAQEAPAVPEPAREAPAAATQPAEPAAEAATVAKTGEIDPRWAGLNPREADSGELKDFLSFYEVEFSKTAPRSTIVRLAEKKLVELAPF